MRYLFRITLLYIVVLCSSWADEHSKLDVNVLILQGFHPMFPWTRSFQNGIITAAQQSDHYDFHLYFINLDLSRFPNLDYAVFIDHINRKFHDKNIDFIVTDSAPSTQFLNRSQEHFEIPWKARIHYSPYFEDEQENALYFGRRQSKFVTNTIEMMLTLNPELKEIIIVESVVIEQQSIHTLVADHLKQHPDIQLTYISEFSASDLFQKVSGLSEEQAILYGLVFYDNESNRYQPRRFLTELASHSSVPIYGVYSAMLNAGIVGGHLVDPEVTADSVVQAMEDFLHSGKFKSQYQNSKSYLNLEIANSFNLPISKLADNVTFINPPKSWAQKHSLSLVWGSISTAVITTISIFWVIKLRWLNHQLAYSNSELKRARSSLAKANTELKRQSSLDPLTGLLNRRAVTPIIEQAIAECWRYQTPSVLMLIDLDDFKTVNDRYGHNVGDSVLKSYSQLLFATSRQTDSFARWGGEEFLILAKNSTLEDAHAYIKLLRQRTSFTQLIEGHEITFSAGLVEIKPGIKMEQSIDQADKAMYQAKASGKNCTVVYKNEAFNL